VLQNVRGREALQVAVCSWADWLGGKRRKSLADRDLHQTSSKSLVTTLMLHTFQHDAFCDCAFDHKNAMSPT
jgi:hypothetical protein